MKNTRLSTTDLQDVLGQRLARRLSDAADQLPHDITERLRVARQQALKQALIQLKPAQALVMQASGASALQGGAPDSAWSRWFSLAPILALIVSLFAVNMIISEERDNELAEIDTALLTDDLPPHAYTDPGFVQFLKIPLLERSDSKD
jgi:hypothetical protein